MADKKPLSKNLLGFVISAGVVFLAPLLGLLITVLFLRGAFSATATADPSQKARLLAEGISEAMNGTAFGLVISCVAFVPASDLSLSWQAPCGPGSCGATATRSSPSLRPNVRRN